MRGAAVITLAAGGRHINHTTFQQSFNEEVAGWVQGYNKTMVGFVLGMMYLGAGLLMLEGCV